MKALVCGGRGFDFYDQVLYTLGGFPITRIIHGGARGADAQAARYAREANIPQSVFKPDWGALGKAAGPLRNQKMLDEGKPDIVIAFAGGRGTADMVRRAKAAGVKVHFASDAAAVTPGTSP